MRTYHFEIMKASIYGSKIEKFTTSFDALWYIHAEQAIKAMYPARQGYVIAFIVSTPK